MPADFSPRLIDLHVDWLLQYAPETRLFAEGDYDDVAGRLPQVDGYLGTTAAAVLSCWRRSSDWAEQPAPWRTLGEMLARLEAEFSGRLLQAPADLHRWRDDPEGMTWGILGVEGFDFLIRSHADLTHLPRLFERGVRLFQPTYDASGLLAGSAAEGDDRGLTDLGRAFLETLADAAGETGPRPLVDLAHLNPRSMGEVLDWFETDTRHASWILPIYSHGAVRHANFERSRAIQIENLRRLRELGGTIGFCVSPPFYQTGDEIKTGIETAAAIPFQGRAGYEGIAIGTDFLGVNRTLPGLGTASEIVDFLRTNFPNEIAHQLIRGNAETLIERMISRG